MILLPAVLTILVSLPPDPLQDGEGPLGVKKVHLRDGAFYKGPSRLSGVLRDVVYGEDVTVTAVEKGFSKCTLKDGTVGYIYSTSLESPKKFKPGPSNEKEIRDLEAQGYEAKRGLNPEIEKEHRAAGGRARDEAYQKMEALEKSPEYKPNRAELEKRLMAFRKEGKLGEFSPVK